MMDDGYGDEGEEEGSAEPDALSGFFANPQFEQVRQRLLQDPNFFQEFMNML